MKLNRRQPVTIALSTIRLLVVTAGIVLAFTARSSEAQQQSPNSREQKTVNSQAQENRLNIPNCPALAGPSPVNISITTKSARQPTFEHDCYYAAAGQKLTIRFHQHHHGIVSCWHSANLAYFSEE